MDTGQAYTKGSVLWPHMRVQAIVLTPIDTQPVCVLMLAAKPAASLSAFVSMRGYGQHSAATYYAGSFEECFAMAEGVR